MNSESAADLGHVRQIAANYGQLQGLKAVPFGLLLIGAFVAELFLPDSREAFRAAGLSPILLGGSVFLVGLIAAVAICPVFSAYYRRHLGIVEPTTSARLASGLLVGIGTFIIGISVSTDFWFGLFYAPPPINPALLAMALFLFAHWWLTGRFLTHYLFLAGIGAILGLLPLLGIGPVGVWWHLREATLYMAAWATVGGFLDHRLLIRSFVR